MISNFSSSFFSSALYLFVIVSLAVLLYRRRPGQNKSHGLKEIPGPPANILGQNVGQFDALSPFLTFQQWARQYGPIFKVKVGFQDIISVNDPRMAKELFEKRGAKYSSRGFSHVGYELLSQGKRIAFSPSGPQHTAFRRQMHNVLSVSRTKENHKVQELESRQVLQEILNFSETAAQTPTPNFADVQSTIRRYTLSVMMTLGFGHRVRTLHDEVVHTVFEIMEDMARTIQPGRYLVDIFPVMKRLPYFLRTWEHEVNHKMRWQWPFLQDLLDRTTHQMTSTEQPNTGLIRVLLEQRKDMTDSEKSAKFLDDKSIAYQAMTFMEAGADTTAITIMNFVLGMVLHPRVMRKGQASVDAVVSQTRLPTFEDLSEMAYIKQIVKEVMRWRPVLLMGIPHLNTNTTPDVLDGYSIPPQSLIFGNIWAMQHDPTTYPDPEELVPERFDGPNQKSAFESSMEADAMDREHYIFGWGRRICPGIHLAEASVLLLAARLLWAFDIVPAKDQNGNPLEVTADPVRGYENSIIASTKVFPVEFGLRSQERGKVIREAYRDALGTWEGMGLDLFRDV